MPEQKKKPTPETTKVESPKIPNVAYPLKPRSNTTNLSQQYFNHLAGDESARFLFNNSGLWHQGIHLRASKFPSSEFENNKICAIADGKLIAYKVDREYKTDAKSESSKASAVYSTGFFLLKHEVAYPKDNVLTFYSLYRHTAKLSDYKSGIEEIVGITKSASNKADNKTDNKTDNKIVIRDAKNQPLNPLVELKNGVTIGVRRNTKGQEQFDELLWYRETQGNKTIEHKPKSGEHWRIFHQSYEEMQSEQIKGLPLLSKHKIDTQADVEVKLDKPIEIKAGEELGLMGEYNQIGESGEKLLHLEVFTYDNIEQFKAKAEAAYKQDKEKKGIKDNFLYVARGSQLYSIANDEAVALEKSKVEIMVPLADVAKKTVKKKTDKTGKDYYNVQPYLYSLPHKNKEGGIYVDSSHLTHGLLFPGVNIFNQSGNGLCIFKHPLHQNIDPKSDLTTEQKNELDPMFKSIMDELDLEKDKNAAVSFEAGKLKDLLLSPVQQRRLTGIVAKHDSEWKKTRTADFSQTCGVYRANGKEEIAKIIEKRVEDLSIKLEVDGFNTDKQAYYLHPLGMIGFLQQKIQNKCKHCGKPLVLSKDFLRKICSPEVSEVFLDALVLASQNLFGKYKVDSCRQIIHLLAQGKQETTGFTAFRESLNYTRKSFTAESLYRLSPTVINNGFIRKGLGHYTREQKLQYIDKNLLGNDKAYGEHCYGVAKYPGNDYRGRGFIHLTHYETYEKCSKYIPFDIEKNPSLLETNYTAAIESALWFWNIYNKIGNIADSDNKDLSNDSIMRDITKIVNKGLDGYANRVSYKNNIKKIFFEMYGECK